MTFAKVIIPETQMDQATAVLDSFSKKLSDEILGKAAIAAAEPFERAARQIAPDSVKSGSRAKWSAKLRAKRAGVAQHKNTIGHSTVREYGKLVALYVGPIHPAGNLINVIGHPHQQTLWVGTNKDGKPIGRRTGVVLPATDYIQRAAESTASAQKSAYVSTIQSESEKALASLAGSVT